MIYYLQSSVLTNARIDPTNWIPMIAIYDEAIVFFKDSMKLSDGNNPKINVAVANPKKTKFKRLTRRYLLKIRANNEVITGAIQEIR